ncbi:MAG: hypothetical protein AAGU27_15335 [Dehalobacterium sp.]
MLRKWLEGTKIVDINLPASKWIIPVVVFTQAQWLKINGCCMQVFNGVSDLAKFIKAQENSTILTPLQQEKIIGLLASPTLANAFRYDQIKVISMDDMVCEDLTSPYQEPKNEMPAHEVKMTKDGKKYVRIKGDYKKANKVYKYFQTQGNNPGKVSKDRYSKDTFFSILSNTE